MTWACSRCGACCQHAGLLDKELASEDGPRCRHLTTENLCAIYDQRPAICRRAEGESDDETAAACDAVRAAVLGGEER